MIPIYSDVDVLVAGASSGAVAAALEIQRQGRRVLVVSDLSYFGEESAGALNLWLENKPPVSPLSIKRELETALLQAGIPFLYLMRPVSLIRDEDGRVGGVILAARTSLIAVTCRTIVDASRYGAVARLTNIQLTARPEMPSTVHWNVISNGVPAGFESAAEELHPPFSHGGSSYNAYRLTVPRSGEAVVREHMIRASLLSGKIFVTADIIADVPDVFCGTTLHNTVSDTDFSAAPDIMLLNGLLPLNLSSVQSLDRRDVQESFGKRVGALAAAHERPAKRIAGAHGDYSFAPAFLRQSTGDLDISPSAFPLLAKCDVAVVGGGTGGAPAGIAAARDGSKTIVMDIQHGLGGVGTIGFVSSYYYGNITGFTKELDNEVKKIDAAFTGTQWNLEVKSAIYSRMLRDAGGASWFGSYAFGVRMDGDRVNGILVATPFGAGLVETSCVVDATGNADIAAAAGAPCRVIGRDHAATQGTGLSPRTNPGMRTTNSDHTFIDETDPEGISHAFANARAKFKNDFDVSPMVNSRERRQIYGDYELSPLDILAQRTFPDTIVTAKSNFDTHGFIIHPLFMTAVPDHAALQAYVPFRSMLPRGIEGVLVTGLGVSAHRDALPVIRMQADVQNQGYAAGMAAATAAKGSKRLRDLDIRALQKRLVSIGNLSPDILTHEDSFPLTPEAVRCAAEGDLKNAKNVAILFSYPESQSILIKSLHDASKRRIDAAVILGMMGRPEAAPVLAETISAQDWDEGWNYRGMGQFGASMSRMDTLIIALARSGGAAGIPVIPVIEAKIKKLTADASFSHCRAVAVAAGTLRDARLTRALADLLKLPGMQGHVQENSRDVIDSANSDNVETLARNRSLRELYLAHGLFMAGDADGFGRTILEAYTHDLRGHFARHAKAVLDTESKSGYSFS
ncbi:MAG: FAD-dependent oxidoreductase [Spirochaetes bacterium]|nr:FAD-dependent oxidoreductase [Spirochaetota bacterium]